MTIPPGSHTQSAEICSLSRCLCQSFQNASGPQFRSDYETAKGQFCKIVSEKGRFVRFWNCMQWNCFAYIILFGSTHKLKNGNHPFIDSFNCFVLKSCLGVRTQFWTVQRLNLWIVFLIVPLPHVQTRCTIKSTKIKVQKMQCNISLFDPVTSKSSMMFMFNTMQLWI